MKPFEVVLILALGIVVGGVIGINMSLARIETSLTTGCAMGGK